MECKYGEGNCKERMDPSGKGGESLIFEGGLFNPFIRVICKKKVDSKTNNEGSNGHNRYLFQ